MDKLLIFSNFYSIRNVDSQIETKIKGIKHFDFHKFENSELFKVNTLKDGEIFLLDDCMTQEEYENILVNRDNDTLFILYHLKDDEFKISFNNEFEINEIGQHIDHQGYKYKEVTLILTDKFPDKKQRIIDLIFNKPDKLNIALEFLHECLLKKPNLSLLRGFDTETPCISVIDKGKKVQKNIDQLYKDLKNRPMDDIKTFNNLRDGVLKMAGVE